MTSKATRDEERAYLKEQARYFKQALNDIEKRVNELQQGAENVSKIQKKERK